MSLPAASSWLPALTLAERAAALPRGLGLASLPADRRELARRRFERWRETLAPSEAHLGERLREVGLDEDGFLYLLGEPAEELARRHPDPPPWLERLLAAYEAAVPWPRAPWGDDPHRALLTPFLPLVDQALGRLRRGMAGLVGAVEGAFDAAAVERSLLAALPMRLLPLVSRTLALELQAARLEGRLAGSTPEERYQSFLAGLTEPGAALALLAEYPVLARQLVLHLDQWVESHLEILARLESDAEILRATFFGGRQPRLVTLGGQAGDRHHGGRAVAVATFEGGVRLVYKPRPLAVESAFQDLLGWLGQAGAPLPFPRLALLDRGAYGWVEHVEARPCSSRAEVRRFYTRLGGYLALLHALAATDFHQENLIARGEEPVLVDLESLFHPETAGAGFGGLPDPASDFLRRSVGRVGLLPQRQHLREDLAGVDLSGLGTVEGQRAPTYVAQLAGIGTDTLRVVRDRPELADGPHRPRLEGEAVDPGEFREDLVAGFAAVYRTLRRHHAALHAAGGPFAALARAVTRVIVRPTSAYLRLLQESFHPTLLRNALDRDRFFDRLRQRLGERPALARLVAHEQADLWRGDVPCFTTRPGSRDLETGAPNQRIPEAVGTSGLDESRLRLARLDEADLVAQTGLIEATLATLAMGSPGARRASYPERASAAPVTRERLLAAAKRAAGRLEELALRNGEGEDMEVSWVGLETRRHDNDWEVAPAGPDLYGGLPGIALFLAHLGRATGEERHTRLARGTLVPLLRWLGARREIYPSTGAFNGWGGLFYTAAHLDALRGAGGIGESPEVRELVERAGGRLPEVARAIEGEAEADVVAGLAGCAAGLLAFHAVTGSSEALAAAARCGERLLALATPLPAGIGWPSPARASPAMAGFSHGSAGIALVLLRLAAATGKPALRQAAEAAIAQERTLFSPVHDNWEDQRDFTIGAEEAARYSTVAWCHGATGIGLARLAGLPWLDTPGIRAEIAAALATTRARGLGRSHCLCHGDLGSLELLTEAERLLGGSGLAEDLARRTGSLLASLDHEGFLSGVPGGLETPGLMAGTAGIGYGLLRLAVGAGVPSVLQLEVPRPPGETR